MWIVAIAWMYVAVMMAVAEAFSPQGSVLGAVFTLLLYGIAPLALVMYLLATPARRRQRRAAEHAEWQAAQTAPQTAAHTDPQPDACVAASGPDPDAGGLPSGDAIAPKREEP
ncbi:MAG: hypothetical protein EOP38_19455 [Rubrivivax sp.]|nr:MAG: hypothetical protein EOP38_19455 [Rubrivivax sp.]